MVDNMLREFGLDPEKGHIINGHVPVHQSEGESPIKCDGKVIVIDGGFSKPYQKVTGIAGYTLDQFLYSLFQRMTCICITHKLASGHVADCHSVRYNISLSCHSICFGRKRFMSSKIQSIGIIDQLLDAYRTGIIKEKK